jgi:hypothetical protein
MRKLGWPLLAVIVVSAVAFIGVELWGGVSRSAASILRNADRVEVFRVAPIRPKEPTGDMIGGYQILAVGKEQDPEFAARLSTALRRWGVTRSSKKCGLMPGVAYRVWAGDRALEVLICFKCDDLWPHVVGEPGTLETEWLEFDRVRPELLALTKEAFPDDPEIQALLDSPTSEQRWAVPQNESGSSAVDKK